MIQPFEINVPQSILDDLQTRLHHTRWPEELSGAGWNEGTSLSYLKTLKEYWQQEFDWRKVEKEISAHPNFMADLGGQSIHFLHIKGKGARSIPLLLTHGWPGSFLEMMKLIPLLTEEARLSFDLVIPSIPGFGFSGKPVTTGCNSATVADRWQLLMKALGYDRYGVQGGDIGAGIGTWLALQYPSSIIGLHLNYIPGSYKPYLAKGETVSEEELAYQQFAGDWAAREGAYSHLQATKPLSLAYGLNDSPVGLAAWILEKFQAWSDHQGFMENVFTREELLANVTLYWVTETIYSSMRIYHENSQKPLAFTKDQRVSVPTGFARFPRELPTPPRSYIERGYAVQHWTEMPAGGHFAGMEQPELLARDIRQFFARVLGIA
ncbi:MAG: epoxide hydrolase family protein [Flavisolibacter sp.]